MRRDVREDLVGLIRSNPTAEVVLPEQYYADDTTNIRVVVDGRKVMLHRWLYEQLTGVTLGSDLLWRDPAHDPHNVNPLLMTRRAAGSQMDSLTCPKGHVYAETGEFPPGRPDGRRCVQCYKDLQTRVSQRDGGSDAGSVNRDKTHCKYGHEYTPENTLYWPGDKGRRRCRQCETNRSRKRWNERKNDGNTTQAQAR